MEESWWHEVKDALFDYLDRESEEYSRVTMQLSFNNLPDCLKPCLLYMGMFPEDSRIPASKLISVWIAEGFMQNIESAEDYLMDLISSNVVMLSKRSYNGKVQYCQGSRVSFSFSEELSKFASLGSKTHKPFYQHLRSLITTNTSGQSIDLIPSCQISELRLLKVLDLSSNVVDHFSSATFKPLIHLKYLAVRTFKFDFYPESHLPCIETLIVNNHNSILLPASLWEMEKLRHVEIGNAKFVKQGVFEGSSKLENLRILRQVCLIDEADRLGMLLQRFLYLQQLEIVVEVNFAETSHLKLGSLTQLQILRFTFFSFNTVLRLQLPSNLKKLELIGDHIERVIPFIEGLSNLEYLKLQSEYSVKLEEWCLADITFHKLKFLKLVGLPISRWDVSEESFPLLETLVLKRCNTLKEIPLSFVDIPTLKQIKLIRCNNKSLKASAVRIKEDVEENEGNDCIDLIIE